MVPETYTEFIDDLTYLVKKNIIPVSRIDDAVKRILRVKFVMGLFENPLADNSLVNELGNKVCCITFMTSKSVYFISFLVLWNFKQIVNQLISFDRNIENWLGKQ